MKFSSLFTKLAAVTSLAAASLAFTASAHADLSDLRGVWINVDDNARGLTKVVISGNDDTVTFETWAKCRPSDCAWGQVEARPLTRRVGDAPATADRVMALYSSSLSTKILNAYRSGDQLVVERTTDYSGDRADQFAIDTFKRAPFVLTPILPPTLVPLLPLATNLDKLEGDWKNLDADTRGVTRLQVEVEGEAVKVRAYGSCSPTDCDWGWTEGAPLTTSFGADLTTAERVMAEWDQGFAVRTLVINREGDELVAQITTIYNDSRSDRFSTYRFKL